MMIDEAMMKKVAMICNTNWEATEEERWASLKIKDVY